jgi:hypothetical protein
MYMSGIDTSPPPIRIVVYRKMVPAFDKCLPWTATGVVGSLLDLDREDVISPGCHQPRW